MSLDRSEVGAGALNSARTETIGHALVALGSEYPERPAFLAPNRRPLSYRALVSQQTHNERTLSALGFRSGDVLVGLVQPRTELAVGLATLPVCSTFAPLAGDLPADAYRSLLTRLRPKAVLVDRTSQHVIRALSEELDLTLIELIEDPTAPAGQFELAVQRRTASLEAAPRALPQDAYVLSTSGTTGLPKLVPIGHGEALAYVRTARDTLQYSSADVSCHQSPLHVGGGLRNALLNPLLSGAAMVVLPQADVEAFYRALDDFAVTTVSHAFALYREILRRASDFQSTIAQHKLRFLRTGSGRLDAADIAELEQMFQVPVLVAYSSTEAGSMSHDRLPPHTRKRDAAGLPHGNEIAIRDDGGGIVGVDIAGEIVTRGPMVFRGYLDDPVLNAQSFVDGWYRTGDLGFIDADGFVHVVGRLKDVINRGGEKISPAAIDAVLESIVGVKEAAAFGVPHPTLGEEVVAAIVPQAGAGIDTAQILEQTRARLGARRAPRQLIVLDALPRTSTGKVQRSTLSALTGLAAANPESRPTPQQHASGQAPLSPFEAALGGLWCEVLEIDRADPNDDFFMLGGDSLRGTRLISHVRTLFGVELSIAQLFAETSTIAGMARVIERLRSENTHGAAA